jgi:hypothetical protein
MHQTRIKTETLTDVSEEVGLENSKYMLLSRRLIANGSNKSKFRSIKTSSNYGNGCYHPAQNLVWSRLMSKKAKIRI